MTLSERVVAIHRALEEAGISHAFGGAIALAFMTDDPRGTSDIDVNVFVPAGASELALEALPDGVKVSDGTAERIARDGQIRLWWEETPIDLFFNNLPIHEEAERHSRTGVIGDTEIPILGPVELAVFKAMFDRTRDWGDIEEMLAAEVLDLPAVRAKLQELIGTEDPRFERLEDSVRRVDAR